MVNRIATVLLISLVVFSSHLVLVAKETPNKKGFLVKPSFPINSVLRMDGNKIIRNSNISVKKNPIMNFVDPPKPLTFMALAADNQPLGTDGSLNFYSWAAQSMINNSGQIAFVSRVHSLNGRDWGLFVAHESGIQPIVFGCGSGGGGINKGTCGDPSPIGGTFSGLFNGTEFAPVINDKGDVLFLADVVNAKSNRGLFLYRAATRDIINVVAVGDRSPYGGRFGSIGTGAMNNKNEIVFIAFGNSSEDHQLFLWKDAILTPFLRSGNHTPYGSVFNYLAGWYGFRDGTEIPANDADINDNGTIVFKGCSGQDEHFQCDLFKARKGIIQNLLMDEVQDPAPGIKWLIDVGDPSINNKEDVAFSFNSDDEIGWMIGNKHGWKKIIGSNTLIQNSKIIMMAYSHNPTNPLNDSGDLVFWARLEMPDGSRATRVFLKKADSNRMIIAAKGMKGPFGSLGELAPLPALNNSGDALVSINRAHLLRKNFSAETSD